MFEMRLNATKLCGFLLLVTSVTNSQWVTDSLFDTHTRRGVDYVYNLEFDKAQHEFQQLVNLKADHPAGHFFLAMVEWWRILMDIDNTANDDRFYSMLEDVIRLCDERLDKDENDVTALFFKGGSIGFRGRLRAHRDQWLRAANDGRLALPIVQRAYKLEPENYDVLLGMGIYNYYAEIIPEQYPFVKPVMLFFPKGDKQKGISQLHAATEKARYADIEASYFLLQLYHNYEKQHTMALPLAQKLHQKFPNNPIFHRYLGRTYAALGLWADMKKTFDEVFSRSRSNQTGYGLSAEREAEYYSGLYDMTFNQFDAALVHFFRCDELSRKLDKDGPSGFMTMANLKIGMIFDLQKKRDIAIEQYQKVLKMDDYMDSRKTAAEYLKQPYRQ
jgi:tetratricopeptide (TPR) repeat protein